MSKTSTGTPASGIYPSPTTNLTPSSYKANSSQNSSQKNNFTTFSSTLQKSFALPLSESSVEEVEVEIRRRLKSVGSSSFNSVNENKNRNENDNFNENNNLENIDFEGRIDPKNENIQKDKNDQNRKPLFSSWDAMRSSLEQQVSLLK